MDYYGMTNIISSTRHFLFTTPILREFFTRVKVKKMDNTEKRQDKFSPSARGKLKFIRGSFSYQGVMFHGCQAAPLEGAQIKITLYC